MLHNITRNPIFESVEKHSLRLSVSISTCDFVRTLTSKKLFCCCCLQTFTKLRAKSISLKNTSSYLLFLVSRSVNPLAYCLNGYQRKFKCTVSLSLDNTVFSAFIHFAGRDRQEHLRMMATLSL